MAIIKHDLLLSFVEYDGVRSVFKYLNPDVKLISRNTASSDVWKIYLNEKANVKDELAKISGRACLTSDLWTSCTQEGYICLTVHYVDLNWKLNSKILAFCDMPPPHSGVELAKKIMGLLCEWGIDRKVFSLTLDNASANDNMQLNLKDQLCLQESLLCNGEFFHIRCSAHILNLIVQEGLKVASNALYKIRESIKYVKGSEARMKGFEECVQKFSPNTCVHLRLDVPTRWNSTFLMLDSALKYKRAFSGLALTDKNYKYCPSSEEWSRGEKICEFLEPFYAMTNLISGSSYPTANLYFTQVWKIECLLLKNLNCEDNLIRDMTFKMKEKFDKYWSEYNILLAMAAVFDPRIKLSLLEFCYNSVDPITSEEKMNIVKKKLHQLYDEYPKNSSNLSRTQEINSFNNSSIASFGSSSTTSRGKRMFNVSLSYDYYSLLIFHGSCTSDL